MEFRNIVNEVVLTTIRNRKTFFSLTLIIFGLLFIWLYKNCQFWNRLQTDTFNHLVEYKSKSINGIRGKQILIHKGFLPYLKRVDAYAEKSGVVVKVVQSYRYERKKIRRSVVPPAKWSNHLAGYAIDMNIKYNGRIYSSDKLRKENADKLPEPVKAFIAAVQDDPDLRWGGDFSAPDPVHIDYSLNRSSIDLWREFKDSCWLDFSNAAPVWKFWR